MTAHTRSTSVLALVVTAALLAAAAPAEAIYIVTPLSLHGPEHADVDDDLNFTIGPNAENGTAHRDWAGKKVKVGYSYDQNESADPNGSADAPTDDSGYVERHLFNVTLGENATGSFAWTVPAEVADHNVFVFIDSEDGERLAFAYLAIGDAPPQMRILAGSGPAPELPGGDNEIDTGSTGDETSGGASPAAGEAPAFGVVLLIVVLSAAALGLALLARRS